MSIAKMLLLAALLGSPMKQQEKTNQVILTGYVSAYDERPTIDTALYRYSIGDIPERKKFYVATLSCDYVGKRATFETDHLSIPVVIFDCAGDDGGFNWMQQNNIVVEVGYYLRQAHPEIVGGSATLIVNLPP